MCVGVNSTTVRSHTLNHVSFEMRGLQSVMDRWKTVELNVEPGSFNDQIWINVSGGLLVENRKHVLGVEP